MALSIQKSSDSTSCLMSYCLLLPLHPSVLSMHTFVFANSCDCCVYMCVCVFGLKECNDNAREAQTRHFLFSLRSCIVCETLYEYFSLSITHLNTFRMATVNSHQVLLLIFYVKMNSIDNTAKRLCFFFNHPSMV